MSSWTCKTDGCVSEGAVFEVDNARVVCGACLQPMVAAADGTTAKPKRRTRKDPQH